MSGGMIIRGNIADNAVDDGTDPVKIGGVHNSAVQSYADGDRASMQMDSAGRVLVTPPTQVGFAVFGAQVFAEGANNSSDFTNLHYRGVRLYLDYTAESGTNPTLDLQVQTKDPVSGKYFDMPGALFVQTSAPRTRELVVYPSMAAVNNLAVSESLPLTWRVVATVGGTDTPTVTASVGGTYLK